MAKKRKKSKTARRQVAPGVLVRGIAKFIVHQSGVIALVVLVIIGYYWLRDYCVTDPAFCVRMIDMNPTRFVSRDEVLRVAQLRMGENIFAVDLTRSAHELERMPRIQHAEIRRMLPHTLSVVITERYEVAQVKVPCDSQHYYLIDREGYVLTPVLPVPRNDLVVIDARICKERRVYPGMMLNEPAIDNALRYISRVKHHPAFANEIITSILIDTGETISFILEDGIEVRVSSDVDETIAKLDTVKKILQDPARASLEYIDLRFKDVAVKNKGKR